MGYNCGRWADWRLDGRTVGQRLGSARLGLARLGLAPLHSARLGSARLGSAWLGFARLSSAWLGAARLGSARPGSARLGSAQLSSAQLGLANPTVPLRSLKCSILRNKTSNKTQDNAVNLARQEAVQEVGKSHCIAEELEFLTKNSFSKQNTLEKWTPQRHSWYGDPNGGGPAEGQIPPYRR